MDTDSQDIMSSVSGGASLPPNDYVSPGLAIVIPDAAFPNMVAGDTRVPQWLWLRKWVEQNWYTDSNHPYAGFASRDEAAILYNSALQFRGKPCLEVGCWRGWSAVHLALGSGNLQVIDPILNNPEFADSIRSSCAAAGVLDCIEFHAGFSPAAIDDLSNSLNLRWSLVFIDADHEGDAPRLDAEAAMRNAADDAMVLLHDLASPFVAAGLDALRNAGWRTMIYQTMQIMGVAWRGNVEPVRHIPDPKVFWTLPKHLAGYEVSGWKTPTMPRIDGAWWPQMSLEDRRNAAMMRAQAIEDQLVVVLKEHDRLNAELRAQLSATQKKHEAVMAENHELALRLTSSDALALSSRAQYEDAERQLRALNNRMQVATVEAVNAAVYTKLVEKEFVNLTQRVRFRTARLKSHLTDLRYWTSRTRQAIADRAHQESLFYELASWAARSRVLIGLLRRSTERREEVLRDWVLELGLRPNDVAEFISWFTRSRVLFGLMRRSWRSREAIVALELFRRTSRVIDHALLQPDEALLKSTELDLVVDSEHRSLAWAWQVSGAQMANSGKDNLGPYFGDVDFESDAVLAWVKVVPTRVTVLRSAEANILSIEKLRNNPLFREAYYCALAGIKAAELDPVLHYILIGEALGIKPSPDFDPWYYANRYIDVLQSGQGLLEHYTEHGHKEGRRALPPTRLHSNFERFDNARQNIIIVLHETSRTGAPILGWNIAKRLSNKYNIFTILLGGGALTAEMHAISAETHGPFQPADRHRIDLTRALEPLFDGRIFSYAIVNSSESRALIEVFADRLVPTLFLMHEFGSYVHPLPELTKAFDWSDEIVFPAELVAHASEVVYPPLLTRHLRILPQGMSDLPSDASPVTPQSDTAFLALAEMKTAGVFFVLGAGSVSLRKGIDLFIATAAAAVRTETNRVLHFVWIGHGYRPDHDMGYSVYLREQVERSGLSERVTFLDEVSDLEAIYGLADLFLLTSRLDPLPNVSIDAAWRGLPVVCFRDASGTADILLRDASTSLGVVPHLDAQAAGEVVAKLATDEDLRRELSQATANLARSVFNMDVYVEQLDSIGSRLAVTAAQWRSDSQVISADWTFQQEFFLGAEVVIEARSQSVCRYIAQSSKLHRFSRWMRRPAPGFNPELWHEAKKTSASCVVNPFASFIRAGKLEGLWQVPVLQNRPGPVIAANMSACILLHIVTDDAGCLVDLINRLGQNNITVDLLVSVESESYSTVEKRLREIGSSARVVDGRIDDIPSLMAYLAHNDAQERYRIIGHVAAFASTQFPNWQQFQWEHLVGGRYAMVDIILNRFADLPNLGLVFSAEPYLCDWDERSVSRINDLASALGVSERASKHGYDFPDSGMFWIRRESLETIREIALNDGRKREPFSPSAEDLERLLPLACRAVGAGLAVTYVPGIGW